MELNSGFVCNKYILYVVTLLFELEILIYCFAAAMILICNLLTAIHTSDIQILFCTCVEK
jgi:hypothetical protein